MDAKELRLQPKGKRMPSKMLQRGKDWLSKMLSEHLDLQVGQEPKDLLRIHHRILGPNPLSSREAVLVQPLSLEQRGM